MIIADWVGIDGGLAHGQARAGLVQVLQQEVLRELLALVVAQLGQEHALVFEVIVVMEFAADEAVGAGAHGIVQQEAAMDISNVMLVVDGLFGSGLNKPLAGGFASLVKYINSSAAKIESTI